MNRGAEEIFFQRRHTDGRLAHGKMFNRAVIRKTEIKVTVRHHLRPVRTAVIRKAKDNKSCEGSCTKGNEPLHLVGGNVNWCSLRENSMQIPQKIKSRATI